MAQCLRAAGEREREKFIILKFQNCVLFLIKGDKLEFYGIFVPVYNYLFCLRKSFRYLFAASRQRQFPAFLSCVNSKHDSPRAALFIHVID